MLEPDEGIAVLVRIQSALIWSSFSPILLEAKENGLSIRERRFESAMGRQDAQCRFTLWQDGLSILVTMPLKLQLESYLQGWT